MTELPSRTPENPTEQLRQMVSSVLNSDQNDSLGRYPPFIRFLDLNGHEWYDASYPEERVAYLLNDLDYPNTSKTAILNTISEELKKSTDSLPHDETGVERLRRISNIIDLSKPEELRKIVVKTFSDSLALPKLEEESNAEMSIFYLAATAVSYADKDHPEDLEMWQKAYEKPVLKGIVLQVLLRISPQDQIVTDILKESFTSLKDWATRSVVRYVVRARGTQSVSATINEFVKDPNERTCLKDLFSDDPELQDLI